MLLFSTVFTRDNRLGTVIARFSRRNSVRLSVTRIDLDQ